MESRKVDSKLLLFTSILVLIALLLLNAFLKDIDVNEIWDYKNIEGYKLAYKGEKISERSIYYNLESVINKYLNSYINTYSQDVEVDGKLNYEEYYKYLTAAYKNYLSKNEYKEVAENFLNKFYVKVSSSMETMEYMDVNRILKEVYKLEENTYLCKLQSSFNSKIGYIAIVIDDSENIFNIAYIE